jgi:molybdopterin adenylyltransferase
VAPGAAIITISSSRAAGEGPDLAGPRLEALVRRLGLGLTGRELIPDEQGLIEARLRHWSDVETCALILTSGGTGLAPSDVTPEATRAVIEREAPGIPHAMRESSRAHTPNWMLSRAVAGTRGATLIVNFPGNPASIEETGEAIAGPLTHALGLLSGQPSAH